MPIIKSTPDSVLKALAETDWDALDAMTDEDIRRQIRENPDAAPEATGLRGWKQVDPVDVHAIRQKIGLTQREFALLFAISIGTVRNWEQGRRVPRGPARALLNIIHDEPEAVLRSLATRNAVVGAKTYSKTTGKRS